MANYRNINAKSSLESVEFMPLPEGNFSFFTMRTLDDTQKMHAWLTSEAVGQEVVAQTRMDDKIVLVTHGDKSSADIIKLLGESGEKLEIPKPKFVFNPWKWRGNFSNAGQGLNLLSAFRKPGGVDAPKLTFVALNFAASGVNSIFGGQKREDNYQLLDLKKNVNQLLGKYVADADALPAIDDDRDALRHEKPLPKTIGQRCHDIMKANSVTVGEIGLRYLGSIAMTFPIKNWPAAMVQLREGSVAGAFKAARNKDATNFYTGATYITGKTVGLFSKVPDPFNPAPHTAIDTIREKYLFRLSSLIETGAAATLAVGNLKVNAKTGQRDLIGAAGGASLTAGLTTRLFAKFGTREVDMDELYAHTTDVLAQTEPAKLPQLIADSAAYIKEHFEDKPMAFGEIYTRLMSELYQYHHIALDNLGAEPEERVAKISESHAAKVTRGEPPKRSAVPAPHYADKVHAAGEAVVQR